MPSIGDENNGGRVADTFNLMPGWIRSMCTINGEKIETGDYSAFHPNIIMSLAVNDMTKYLTHQQIADELNIDLQTVKTEHLSFFNKHPNQMVKSPIFDYYNTNHNGLMAHLYTDKVENRNKTHIKMFSKEVEIMTDVITRLNQEEIYVGYVYDELFCESKHRERMIQVMNETVIRHNVYTVAK